MRRKPIVGLATLGLVCAGAAGGLLAASSSAGASTRIKPPPPDVITADTVQSVSGIVVVLGPDGQPVQLPDGSTKTVTLQQLAVPPGLPPNAATVTGVPGPGDTSTTPTVESQQATLQAP